MAGKAKRSAEVERRTKETAIRVRISLDGAGKVEAASGVGFFDHMLDLLGRHALFDLALEAKGDLAIDAHHTIEDAGIALGEAVAEALGDKSGIARFGFASVPMDEALCQVSLDLSGRGSLAFTGAFGTENVGEMPTEVVEDFLNAFCANAGANAHVSILAGRNAHHTVEAVFKALGRALRAAAAVDPREKGVPSTKGVL